MFDAGRVAPVMDKSLNPPVPLVRSQCPGVCLVAGEAGDGTVENKPGNTLGIGSGKQGTIGTTLGYAHQDRAPAAGSVHDGEDIVHGMLESGWIAGTIGETHAALVKQHQPAAGRQPFPEGNQSRIFPDHVQMGNHAPDKEKVGGALANHLVGNVDIATAHVTSGYRRVS